MIRTIDTERRYAVGQFKYVHLRDIVELDEKHYADVVNYAESVRLIQLLSFEVTYRKYLRILAEYPTETIEDLDTSIPILEEIKIKELEDLYNIIHQNNKKEEGEK
jgi:hypothetical protein